jgi:GAF domain-containing protein
MSPDREMSLEDAGEGRVIEEAMRELAGFLFSGHSTQDILYAVARLAQQTIPGCVAGSVTQVDGGRPHTTVHSADLALRVDMHQYGTNQGPCLDAIRRQSIVRVDVMEETGDWPAFMPLAVAEGVRSSLSLPLIAADEIVGALNLYGTTLRAFEGAEAVGQLFATQAGVSLANATAFDRAARMATELSLALEHRDVIGQAKGILMAQQHIDADAAFTVLRRASQRSNTKLYDVARELVERHSQSRPPR